MRTLLISIGLLLLITQASVASGTATTAPLAYTAARDTLYLQQGLLARSRQAYDEAISAFIEGMARAPHDLNLRLELAVTYSWNGQLAEALEQYEIVLRLDPDNLPARLGKARILSWQGRHAEAIARYTDLLKQDPENIEALNGLAFTHRAGLRYRRARAYYEQVLILDPDNTEARQGLNALKKESRLEGSLSIGTLTIREGRHVLGNRLHAVYRLHPRVTLTGSLAQESEDEPTPVGASSMGEPELGKRSYWRVGADVRLRSHTVLGAAYQYAANNAFRQHALSLSVSQRVSQRIILLGALQPGVSGNSDFALLYSGGVLASLSRSGYVLLQVFQFHDFDGYRSDALAASSAIQVTKYLTLKPTVAFSGDSYTRALNYSLDGVFTLSTHLRLGVQLGEILGRATRHRFGVTVSYRR